ncbi:hypothetical protein EYV94_14645 [Puteibacter caeruleilacunae]|nr:hypothetical protein EYV94_14645 [Puteibacter caeruleilacunae]
MLQDKSFYIAIGLIGLYLYVSIKTQIAINKTTYLSEDKKKLNSVLVWSIPFVWALLIRNVIKSVDMSVMTKDKRNIDKSHFYESGKGIYGGVS